MTFQNPERNLYFVSKIILEDELKNYCDFVAYQTAILESKYTIQ